MSTELKKESIFDFMNELSVDAKVHTRQLHVLTGQAGKSMFDAAIKKQVRIDCALRKLVTARSMKRLTKQEADTVRAMIHSPDEDNFTVAEAILEEKTKR